MSDNPLILPRRPTHLALVPWVLAPSAAGKTTFVDSNPAVIDGDEIVARAIGWPDESREGARWWTTPAAAVVHAENYAAIRGYASYAQRTVVFNGWVPERPENIVGVVLPPMDVLVRNMRARHAQRGPHAFPRNVQDIEANLEGLRNAHPRAEVYKTFDDAVAGVQAKMAKTSDWQLAPETRKANLATITALWVADEASESLRALAARDIPQANDAVWDALGLLVARAVSMTERERSESVEEYFLAQARRGRGPGPHYPIIRAVAKMAGDSATAAEILTNKWASGKLTGIRFALEPGKSTRK